MANNDNLKPFDSNQNREEAKKNGRKGGIKSGEAKRRRKTMRAMLDYLLEKELTNKNGEKATTLEAMMASMIKQSISGNVRACEFIRDTIGQKPTEKVEATNATITVTDEKTIESVMNKLKDL